MTQSSQPPQSSPETVSPETVSPERRLLETLNPAQRAAVLHGDGPLLVLAGAGSGKTRVIVHRIAHLIQVRGIPPWRILAVTFTNKAAGELRQRLEHLIGPGARRIWAMTFHSFCARFLRIEGHHIQLSPQYVIFDTDDQRSLIKRILRDMNLEGTNLKPASVASSISQMKTRNIFPGDPFFDEGDENDSRRLLGRIYEGYEQGLHHAGAVDFDDLLQLTVRILEDKKDVLMKWRKRFDHILIDEYQDTNTQQYLIANYLAGEDGNICAVGDDDQSIYKWRGASVRNILEFEKDFDNVTIVALEENYRSTGVILDAAWNVVKQLPHRHPKKLQTTREKGERIQVYVAGDEEAEAAWVADRILSLKSELGRDATVAVLYRANWQSRVIEGAMADKAILYRIIGSARFYDRMEVRDVIAYLRLVANPDDEAAFRRIINTPRRGIGNTTLQRLEAFAQEQRISLATAARRVEESPAVTGKAEAKITEFCRLMDDFRRAATSLSVGDLIHRIREDTGYDTMLAEEENADDRKANLDELVSQAENFEEEIAAEAKAEREEGEPARGVLEAFLERVSLLSDVDDTPGADRPATGAGAATEAVAATEEGADTGSSRMYVEPVSLMTLHSAKGLEFNAVIIIGLEDGVFPHQMVLDTHNDADIDEERRLFYVGMTRAKDRLIFTHADTRRVAGIVDHRPRCRFIGDIPPDLMRVEHAAMAAPSLFDTRISGRPKRSLVGRKFEQEWPREGDMVRHSRFGVGQVLMARGRGDDRTVLVDFGAKGEKSLKVAMANLEEA